MPRSVKSAGYLFGAQKNVAALTTQRAVQPPALSRSRCAAPGNGRILQEVGGQLLELIARLALHRNACSHDLVLRGQGRLSR